MRYSAACLQSIFSGIPFLKSSACLFTGLVEAQRSLLNGYDSLLARCERFELEGGVDYVDASEEPGNVSQEDEAAVVQGATGATEGCEKGSARNRALVDLERMNRSTSPIRL